MNEELLQEIKSTLPWLLAAAVAVGAYYGIKGHLAAKRAAASEIVAAEMTASELEDAVSKFGGAKSGGMLKLRLAKTYFDAGNFDGAMDLYSQLEGKAPDGFAEVPVVGKAQCLEALGKFAEAAAAFDAFAEANPKSPLTLTAQLGAARAYAQGGDRAKALARLDALKSAAGEDDYLGKARIEATIDLVKRYEKRAATSLFDAADAAQKQIENETAKPAVPAADAPAAKTE